MKTILSALGLSLLIFTSCGGQKKVEVDFIQHRQRCGTEHNPDGHYREVR